MDGACFTGSEIITLRDKAFKFKQLTLFQDIFFFMVDGDNRMV